MKRRSLFSKTSWPNQSQIFSDYLQEAGLTGLLTDVSLCSWSNPGKKKINFISPRRFRNKYENTERLCKFFVRP
ncbi:hypothetical protein DPL31_24745 [Escherichia coli]|nr:hypothetical protein [Escherichia coli]EGE3930553.1 hypothetical protein [Escherichia coli]PBQ65686.1 hypothetical protein COD48_24525 [Escherichia coli]PBQ70710.1 hypothetical protein COD43_24205 [Escherichia coli]PBQ97064.1 hypothetical protein COD34_21290 [Escherichia coli]